MKTIFSTKKFLLSLLSILILVLSQVVASLAGSIAYITSIPDWVGNIAFGIVYVFLAYFLIKILCERILKTGMNDFYITKIQIKPIWIISGVLLPVLVSVVFLLMPGEMIKNQMDTASVLDIVTVAVFYVGFGAGVVEEMVFRGIIMSSIEKRWNKKIAIIVPSVAFGLLHIIGSDLDFASTLLLIAAGTGVGILFSLITYESGSVWNSAVIHGLWNCIMIGGILNIGAAYDETAIFSYVLNSKSMIVTGGDFGIESSIISICGYSLFSILAFLMWKRQSKNSKTL